MMFGVEKIEWCGYPMVKKIEDVFTRFDRIHKCDRHPDGRTDGRTLHDGIGRACCFSDIYVIARQKLCRQVCTNLEVQA